MGWFGGVQQYDRTRILGAAARARAKSKRRKAIALYRSVLAVERSNPELHARIAPLLAETGQHFDAWVSYQTLAQTCLRDGSTDRALAVYREAAGYLPHETQVWLALARLHLKRGKRSEAVEVLLEGACQFGSRWHWPEAVHLLRRIHSIAPWEFDAVFELARLLAKSDQAAEARRFLEGLESRYNGERLRRVYAAQFRLNGDLRYAWLWLRSALRKPHVETSFG
ncbi:MAG: tetratricopeptide repeat protein [Deltaproteobacteria bacterium]|nr:tetratricopeptide repeat protein [Deltaproteobacteria bacterium]MBW2666876.1 tetratricopeptide repeat protein [Deltaproteobacteria bacterium]